MKNLKDTKSDFISFLDHFKNFLLKRNAIDMALGIIIGTSFSRVVSSLVGDIVMPPIGLIFGGVNFKDLKIILKSQFVDKYGCMQPEVAINYGKFIQVLIDFLIIAFTVYAMISLLNKLIHQNQMVDWDKFINK